MTEAVTARFAVYNTVESVIGGERRLETDASRRSVSKACCGVTRERLDTASSVGRRLHRGSAAARCEMGRRACGVAAFPVSPFPTPLVKQTE